MDNKSEIAIVVNKTFMNGINDILALTLLNLNDELEFSKLLNLLDKIELIEKSL